MERLLLHNDRALIRAYVDALLKELALDGAVSVLPTAIELTDQQNDLFDGYEVFLQILCAPSEARIRAMRRVLSDPALQPHRSLNEL